MIETIKKSIEDWVTYCKLKGTNGGVVMSEDAVREALTHSHISLLTKMKEELEGEKKKCKFCNKEVDSSFRDYDGNCNCDCENGKYDYEHDWEAIGYNQALQDQISKIDTLHFLLCVCWG